MCAGVVNSKSNLKSVSWNRNWLLTLSLRGTKFLVLEQLVPWKWRIFGPLLDLMLQPHFYKALLAPFRFLTWHFWDVRDLFCQLTNSFEICAFPLIVILITERPNDNAILDDFIYYKIEVILFQHRPSLRWHSEYSISVARLIFTHHAQGTPLCFQLTII